MLYESEKAFALRQMLPSSMKTYLPNKAHIKMGVFKTGNTIINATEKTQPGERSQILQNQLFNDCAYVGLFPDLH